MKILLTHCYSIRNKGDAAITSVMIQKLKAAIPGVTLSMSTMEDAETIDTFEGIPVLTSFFYEAIYTHASPLLRVLSTIWVIGSTILWSGIYRITGQDISIFVSRRIHTLLQSMTEADAIVGVGGGYLSGDSSIQGYITLLLHLHVLFIARIVRKPVVLYAQSIGPFAGGIQKIITVHLLKKTKAIFVREHITETYLKQLHIPPSLILYAPDAGFLLSDDQSSLVHTLLHTYGITQSVQSIFITVKNVQQTCREQYEKSLAEFADWLILHKKYRVVFIPQVTSSLHNDDDRVVMKRIRQLMKSGEQALYIKEELNHKQIKSMYAHASIVIATRMHSAIFAITSYIPTIAIAYEWKTTGIMKDMGLSEWAIPVEHISFDLLQKKFEKLTASKKTYIEQLNSILPAYIAEAERGLSERLKQELF